MRCFYLQARFAAFRPFVSGSFRPTAGFMTPSAAYGLLLNLAGVEMRHDDGQSTMTLILQDLPHISIALGAKSFPQRHCLMQQLHNYPIGSSGKEHAINTKGNKYNIIPVKREFLSDIRAYICISENDELERWIVEGLSGKRRRNYGLPFLGDNSFLIDRFEPATAKEPVWWYEKIDEEGEDIRENVNRLTTTIDRADLSKTRSYLFAPAENPTCSPSAKAWINLPESPD
ncbi:CRISPR-associated protein Cas5 [Desulfococcus multivorans]|uniref:CRISPR-associated protein Cas5 n=1 Tax=Desulfococcus multivorans DSM 2059 TaxID=1121405 RepID=S7TSE0_DESML|nr:CRISPR-associated protein Cas5 [Desulfococcus multivorans]AOY57180.1 Cas5: CRISPR-associated protein, Cas5 [Desulfococcus multivorans]AQU99667.1 hypothetical protein B2D07_01955 [Desulfococcus multivorans]EPR39931.1 CRISPR-associated protein Cas5 [Desulfococcus multivorans DSM 2059]SKA23240.1 CRISPR-associated protein Cas5t [Desulfococcus multivorans DSM 2059]